MVSYLKKKKKDSQVFDYFKAHDFEENKNSNNSNGDDDDDDVQSSHDNY